MEQPVADAGAAWLRGACGHHPTSAPDSLATLPIVIAGRVTRRRDALGPLASLVGLSDLTLKGTCCRTFLPGDDTCSLAWDDEAG